MTNENFLTIISIVLGVGIIGSMIRAIIGPTIADRIVAINMIGSFTISIIAILSVMLHEGYLLDVCLIYVLISFLAVVVLTNIFINNYLKHKIEEDH
jgi:multicomponent Na+:H+ antiporter subunit F